MALPLGQRIFWWSAVSTLVVLFAVFLVVDRTFRNTILSDLEERLDANLQLASELNGFERDELRDRVRTLALEPTLRAAVETRDQATVSQNLDRLLGGSRLDWLAVTTPEGEVVTATPSAPLSRLTRSETLVREARDFDTGDLWRDSVGLMEVHASALYFGRLQLGVLLGGSRMGTQRANRLAMGTRQQVAIVSDGRLLAADSITAAGDGAGWTLSSEGFSELRLDGEP